MDSKSVSAEDIQKTEPASLDSAPVAPDASTVPPVLPATMADPTVISLILMNIAASVAIVQVSVGVGSMVACLFLASVFPASRVLCVAGEQVACRKIRLQVYPSLDIASFLYGIRFSHSCIPRGALQALHTRRGAVLANFQACARGRTLHVCKRCYHNLPAIPNGADECTRVFPVSPLSFSALLNYSLRLNSVGTYQIMKVAVLPAVMTLAFFGGTVPSRPEVAAAGLVVVGTLVCTVTDGEGVPVEDRLLRVGVLGAGSSWTGRDDDRT
jgi:hypothetical protein